MALPARAIIPVVVVGELEAFALKSDWGYQKVSFMQNLFERYPIVEISREITPIYARIDAYSQGNLKGQSTGLSARNMERMTFGLRQLRCTSILIYIPQIMILIIFRH